MALQMPGEISFVRVVLQAQVALKARSGLTTPLDVIQIRALMNEHTGHFESFHCAAGMCDCLCSFNRPIAGNTFLHWVHGNIAPILCRRLWIFKPDDSAKCLLHSWQ